jgi:hypothetical protein
LQQPQLAERYTVISSAQAKGASKCEINNNKNKNKDKTGASKIFFNIGMAFTIRIIKLIV